MKETIVHKDYVYGIMTSVLAAVSAVVFADKGIVTSGHILLLCLTSCSDRLIVVAIASCSSSIPEVEMGLLPCMDLDELLFL